MTASWTLSVARGALLDPAEQRVDAVDAPGLEGLDGVRREVVSGGSAPRTGHGVGL